jgi:hypothetical protein
MHTKLSRLKALLPEGLLVDAAWLQGRGYSLSLVAKYVNSGWLEQPGRGAYRLPRTGTSQDPNLWISVVASLQGHRPLLVIPDGRTALALHDLIEVHQAGEGPEIHVFGARAPLLWAQRLVGPALRFHRARLFDEDPLVGMTPEERHFAVHLTRLPLGGSTRLRASTPERAILEFLDEVPTTASFAVVDQVFKGLGQLDPWRLSKLLTTYRSMKVKRLALWFAERHHHGWSVRLHRDDIDLGEGKRAIVPGGRLDRAYAITVPRDM